MPEWFSNGPKVLAAAIVFAVLLGSWIIPLRSRGRRINASEPYHRGLL